MSGSGSIIIPAPGAGGGGAPSGAAGGDLAGTYPNPNVAALHSATTSVNVAAATAPSANQVLTASSSTAASWVTPVASTLKSATTSIDVAAATAPSAGQVLTASSSTVAAWVSPASTPRVQVCSASNMHAAWSAGGIKGQTALKPQFYPIIPPGPSLVVTGVKIYVNTLFAASTAGVAIYSIVYSGAGTFTATKVATLGGSTLATTAVGPVGADLSGAPVTLDFTANDYVVGVVTSDVTTCKLNGTSSIQGSGAFQYTTALTDCTGTSFPGSFTQAAASAGSATVAFSVLLYTATGKNFI